MYPFLFIILIVSWINLKCSHQNKKIQPSKYDMVSEADLPGKRKRGRPERRFMDVVIENMAEVEVTEEDTVDRNNWRRKIRCDDP